MRVRSLQMNDAHIYCTEEQFEAEFNAVNEMYLKYFKIFGIEKYVMRFCTHDPAQARPEVRRRTGAVEARPRTWCAASFSAAASTTSKCRTKPRSTARRLTCRSGARSAASSPSRPTRWTSPPPKRFGLTYKTSDNTDDDAALHPPRAARHARAFHRLPDRALRRQLPALARARAGARPPDRRRSPRSWNTPAQFKANSAPTKSAPSSTPAAIT